MRGVANLNSLNRWRLGGRVKSLIWRWVNVASNLQACARYVISLIHMSLDRYISLDLQP